MATIKVLQHKMQEIFANHSETIALEYRGSQLNYRDLDKRANYLANWLKNAGVGKGTFVGLYFEDKALMITALLGILKAGCVFVPLDPKYPDMRTKNMLATSRTTIALTETALLRRLQLIGDELEWQLNLVKVTADVSSTTKAQAVKSGETANVSENASEDTADWYQALEIEYLPEDPLYVYFTSGTTGMPKAILGKNVSLLQFITWEMNEFAIGPGVRVSQFTSQCHDPFLRDIFLPLCAGGTICVPDNQEMMLQTESMIQWIDHNRINLIHCTPGLFTIFNTRELSSQHFQDLCYILLAGEKVVPKELKNWYEIFGDRIQLVNMYGPTETTLAKLFYRIKPEDVRRDTMPIGKPIKAAAAIILNDEMKVCNLYEVGQIYIRTPYRTYGYFNDPVMTAERFIPNPFNNDPEDLIYKTGDLGRMIEDQNIEFVGRVDRQIKIRGFRVELDEIENALQIHPGVKSAVILNRETKTGNTVLYAYYVTNKGTGEGTYLNPEIAATAECVPATEAEATPEMAEAAELARSAEIGEALKLADAVTERKGTACPEVTVAELKNYLGSRLPNYMIPAFFIELEQFPLNANGKVDYKALALLEVEETASNYVTPANKVEERLARLWSEILGIEKIGVTQGFLDVGGHSLNALKLVTKIFKEFQVTISLPQIFQNMTIRDIARLIAGGVTGAYADILPIAKGEYYPASFSQKRMYLLKEMLGETDKTYNIPKVFFWNGQLDRTRVEQAINSLVRRHETLRTYFAMVNGELVQKIYDELEVIPEYIDLPGPGTGPGAGNTLGVGQPAEDVDFETLVAEFIRPFNLQTAPLFRVRAVSLSVDRHIFMFDIHHAISDGTSMGILIRDFVMAYQHLALPELKIQYKDYAAWQEQVLASDEFKEKEAFWLNEFTGDIPVLNLPTDYPRPAVQSHAGATYKFTLPKELVAELKKLAVDRKASLFMVLLAAYNTLLYRYTGQTDLVIGSPVAGRNHADVENLIGVFINTLALRNFPEGEKTFTAFLEEVKTRSLAAFEHQEYPFEMLVDKLSLRRDMSRNPLFDIMLVLQNVDMPEVSDPDLNLQAYEFENRVSKFDLSLVLMEEPDGGLAVDFEYCTQLFTHARARQMAQHLNNILQQVVAEPELRLREIRMLSPEDETQLLYDFNATAMEYAATETIAQGFARQVAKTPDRAALVADGRSLSYQELDMESSRLAQILQNHGVGPDEIVGIMLERSPEMILASLATLKAGGAYMPIDPEYPAERITYMLTDSKARVLLTSDDYIGRIAQGDDAIAYAGVVINLNDPAIQSANNLAEERVISLANSKYATSPDNLAYVMYTSGSTGKPKGVMIEQRGVVSLAAYYNQMFKLDQARHVLHMSNVSFDTSVVEIFPPLLYGATIYIIGKELALDRERFIEFARANQINFAQFVPLTLQEILGSSPKVPSLETVIVGSDKLDDTIKDHILSLGYRLSNHYGPTEGTVDALVAICEEGKSTIGKPIANTRAYILDRDNNLAPIGVPGELCISGVGLARGYLNRPDLTGEKFVANPWVAGERMYRTGDLASWQRDGNILFHGRMDNQVKIRGYRIEPAEIEVQLQKHDCITSAVVVDRTDTHGNKYLAAYVVANREITAAELRAHLAQEMPDYMIPAYFLQLERIPLTHNGKVDRHALPAPEGNIDTGVEYVAPTNEVEEKLLVLWKEILGIETIGIQHNFFELGGHSLKAMNLVSRIQKELHVEVPFGEIFKSPTIHDLAQYIVQNEELSYIPILPVEAREYYPVSSAQFRLFISWQMDLQSRSYNMPSALVLEGELDQSQLEMALQKLVQRHETLRTSFAMVDGVLRQKIHPQSGIALCYQEAFEEELDEVVEQFVQPFDLQSAPLFRVLLVKFAEEKHLLLFDMHHIISDGVSMSILTRDFVRLYAGEELPALQVQYKDYAIWHNALMESETMQRLSDYWIKRLHGFKYTALPGGKIASEENRMGRTRQTLLDESLTRRITEFCQAQQMTRFAFMLGIFKIILMRALHEEDITIGIPTAGRGHAELEEMIGVFLNVLVIRTRVQKEAGFKEFQLRLRDELIQAQSHQDYPYETLYARAKELWNIRENSLFSILFNYMPYEEVEELDLAGLAIRPYPRKEVETKYNFTLYINEGRDNLIMYARFDGSLDEQLIEMIMDSFPAVIETVLNTEDIQLKQIALVGKKETVQDDDFDLEFDNEEFF